MLVTEDARWMRYGNPLFGKWPDVPRASRAWYIEVPVGEQCVGCGEEIGEGDFGEAMAMVTAESDEPQICYQHAECGLLGIVGHSFNICSCTDYGGTGSRRLGAIRLWNELNDG